MLKLSSFIEETIGWREVLSQKPYCLSIKEDKEGYILFAYNMIESDLSNPIVQECRGLILRPDMTPVCVPFFKFFNVQETNAATIDWKTARVQEKIDGSIIKLWYDWGWHISTNGTIDAFDAELQLQTETIKNYGDLFCSAINRGGEFDITATLDIDYTYMFEIVSPLNRVVVPYPETKVYHIGTRNNITLEEVDMEIGVEKPKTYSLATLEECLQSVEHLPFSEEGYVVVDANWNRVKIKSPAYVAAHHLKNNGVVTKARVLDMIMLGEQEEFLGYYPEYTDLFEKIEFRLSVFMGILQGNWTDHPENVSRKDFALWAGKESVAPSCMFSMLDGKYATVKEWVYAQNHDKILEWISKV